MFVMSGSFRAHYREVPVYICILLFLCITVQPTALSWTTCLPYYVSQISPLMPIGGSVLFMSVISGRANLVEYLVADVGMDVNAINVSCVFLWSM